MLPVVLAAKAFLQTSHNFTYYEARTPKDAPADDLGAHPAIGTSVTRGFCSLTVQ